MLVQVLVGPDDRPGPLLPAPFLDLPDGAGMTASTDELLASLHEGDPDPWTVFALVELGRAGLELSADQRLTLVQCRDRVVAWVAGHQLAAVDAAARACVAPSGGAAARPDDDWAREEVAAATGQSVMAAHRRIELARRLRTHLPGIAAALSRGRIGFLHALTASELTEALTPHECAQVERRVLPGAHLQTVGRFRAAVRRAVLAIAPEAAERRRAVALGRRRVRVWDEPDGMATIAATVPAEQAMAAWLGPTAAAERGLDDARADAFVERLAAVLGEQDIPRRKGRRPVVNVTVDLPTLLGLADHPGELEGYGPIGADHARAIARDADWRRLLIDPVTRGLLDYGRTTYQPPQPLVDFLHARDRTCRFPGCTRRARWCDDEHAVPFEHGGSTDPANTYELCRRHHRLKTLGLWTVLLSPDGTVEWTSQTGRRYVLPPPPLDE